MDNLYLCFIRLIGEESDGQYRYEFIFTDRDEEVWGQDFDVKPACLCNSLMVDEEYISKVCTIKTDIKLDLIQDNCCFSISDCYDSIIALAWSTDLEIDEIFFKFGETYEEIEKKLAKKSILLG